MKGIKSWLRRIAAHSRGGIRRQVLFLVLVCGLSTFLATLMLFGYFLYGLQDALEAESRDIENVVAESVSDLVGKHTRAWLRTTAENEAAHMGRVLAVNSDDVEFLADSMTMLMKSRDKYGMRQIVNARDMEDIAAGTPYLHCSAGELTRLGFCSMLENRI